MGDESSNAVSMRGNVTKSSSSRHDFDLYEVGEKRPDEPRNTRQKFSAQTATNRSVEFWRPFEGTLATSDPAIMHALTYLLA